MKKVILVSLLALTLASASDLQINLYWQPTDNIDPDDIHSNLPEYLFVDNFDYNGSSLIGICKEKRREPKVFANNNIGQFCSQGFRQTLIQMGVGDGYKDGIQKYILKGQVLEIKVEEEGTYRADVRIKLQLLDSTNTIIWNGVVLGEANRWGKTFVQEMYNETICNAIVECVEKMLKNEEFIKKLTIRK